MPNNCIFNKYDPSLDVGNYQKGMPVYLDGYDHDRYQDRTLANRFDYSVKPEKFYINLTELTVKINIIEKRSEGKPTIYFHHLLGYKIKLDSSVVFKTEQEYGEIESPEKDNYRKGIFKILGIGEHRKDDILNNRKHEFFLFWSDDENDVLSVEKGEGAENDFSILADEVSEKNKKEKIEENLLPYTPLGRQRGRKVELKKNDIVYFDLNRHGEITKISFSAIWRDFCGDIGKDNSTHEYFKTIDEDGYLLPPAFRSGERQLTPVCSLMGFAEEEKKKGEAAGSALAGRLFFSPGILSLDQNDQPVRDGEKILKILASPKPPCPEFYFHDKTKPNRMIFKKGLSPGSGNILPNGRKFYWHNKKPDPFVKPEESKDYINKHCAQIQRIEPIKKETAFDFSIDFYNLTDFELGMLLYSLKPTSKFRHQLGMGKTAWYGKGQSRNCRTGICKPF